MLSILAQERETAEEKQKSIAVSKRRRKIKNALAAGTGIFGGVSTSILSILDPGIANALGHYFLHPHIASTVFGASIYSMLLAQNRFQFSSARNQLAYTYGDFPYIPRNLTAAGREEYMEREQRALDDSEDFGIREAARIKLALLEDKLEEAWLAAEDFFKTSQEHGLQRSWPERLADNLIFRLAYQGDLKHKATLQTELTDAITAYAMGDHEKTAMFLSRAEQASPQQERTNILCLQGIFYDNTAQEERAACAYREAVDTILHTEEQPFVEIPGSKNSVCQPASAFLAGTFVFKTGADQEALRREHEKTEAIYEKLGTLRARIVRPLALVEMEEGPYLVTQRAGKISLKDVLLGKYTAEDIAITLTRSVETVLAFHLSMQDMEESPLFTRETMRDYLERTFIQRVGNGTRFCEGLRFVANGVEDTWTSVSNNDFHPGNVVLDAQGNTSLIDFEKASIFFPAIDVVTLVENYLLRDFFMRPGQDITPTTFADHYTTLLAEEIPGQSEEEAAITYHRMATIQHARMSAIIERFVPTEERSAAKQFHGRLVHHHVRSLETLCQRNERGKLQTLAGDVVDFYTLHS